MMKTKRRNRPLSLILLLLFVLFGCKAEIRVTREADSKTNKASDIPLDDNGGLLGRLFGGSGLDGIKGPGVQPSFGIHFGGLPGIGGGGYGGGYGGGHGGGNSNPLGIDLGPVSINPFAGVRFSKLDGRPIISPNLDVLISPNAHGASLIDNLKHGLKNALGGFGGPQHGGYYPPSYQGGHQGGLYQQGGYSPSYTPPYNPPQPSYTPSYAPPQPAYAPTYTLPQPAYVPPQPAYTPTYTPPRPVYTQPKPVYTPPRPVYTQPKPVYTQPKPVYTPAKPAYYPKPTYTQTTQPSVQYHEHKHDHTHTHIHHNVGGGGFSAPTQSPYDFANYARLKDDKSSTIKRFDSSSNNSVNRSGFLPSSGPLSNPLAPRPRDAIGSRVEPTRSGLTRNLPVSTSSNRPVFSPSKSLSSNKEFTFPDP